MRQKTTKQESKNLDIMKEMKSMNRKITDTYQVALDAWGTGVENRTWLEQL